MSLLYRYGIAATMLAAGVACADTGQPVVKICDDQAGWPPYTFADPQNPTVVRGASAELVVEILKRAGFDAVVTLLPWKRCQSEVETGKFALALNASYSAERAKIYLLSQPYYTLNSALFYRASKYPNPPDVNSVADMQKYRYCGLLGYNYAMYALPPEALDTSARNEVNRFAMLASNRCDFAIGDVELLKAFETMGQLDLHGTAHIPIPGAKPKEFHVMVSRSAAGGEKMLKIINEGLVSLKADKTYAKIFKKYGV